MTTSVFSTPLAVPGAAQPSLPTARGPRMAPQSTPLGDTDPFIPTAARPLRVRWRSMRVDAHLVAHRHDWAQLAYCSSGLVQVTVATPAEMTYIVPPTRGVWIAPGMLHSITTLETAEFRTLYVHASAVPAGWTDCRVITISPLARELILALDVEEARRLQAAEPTGTFTMDGGVDVASIDAKAVPSSSTTASRAHHHQPNPLAAPPTSREQLLMATLATELNGAQSHEALGIPLPHADSADKRLRALCNAVLDNPADRATLAERAAQFGASERTMARLFRDGLGLSYQKWRQQAMLAHALPLLARGHSVGDVAGATGYASESAFSAMFKAAMGESPRFFMQKKWILHRQSGRK